MRILVIDDNHDVADSMRTLLRLLDQEVQVAYSGRDGIALANEWRPAAVFSDIGLPDINGYSIAEHLRKDKTFADTTLVAITAYDTPATQKHAYESGFDLFLSKPADVTALLDTLRAKNRSQGRGPEADTHDEFSTGTVKSPGETQD